MEKDDKVALQGKDVSGTFYISTAAAKLSPVLYDMIENFGDKTLIPVDLPDAILIEIIRFCEHEIKEPRPPNKTSGQGQEEVILVHISDWDKDFISQQRSESEAIRRLKEMIVCANFLNIRPLLDVCGQMIADKIKGLSTEQIRILLGIENDFTPEEEAQIRADNTWVPRNLPQ